MAKIYSLKDRKGLEPDNFGDPKRRLFLIQTSEDVLKAPKRLKRAHDAEAVRDRIINIARRKGLEIPDEWKGYGTIETLDTVTISSKPKSEITED